MLDTFCALICHSCILFDECLFLMSFAHLLIRFFVFVFIFNLWALSSISILDTFFLLYMWFAKIFSRSEVCLFIVLMEIFKKGSFKFDEVQLVFLFMGCIFWYRSRNSLLSLRSQKFSLFKDPGDGYTKAQTSPLHNTCM